MIALRKLTVKDACNLNLSSLLIVRPSEEFSQVIQHFANHSELRGIFVADTEGRLLGVITRTDLLDWTRVKLGAIFQAPLPARDKTIRLLSLMRASTVGEVMHPDSQRAAVKLNDSLAHALRLMIELDLIVLPVIDEANQIVGDLKLSQLLARAIEEGEK